MSIAWSQEVNHWYSRSQISITLGREEIMVIATITVKEIIIIGEKEYMQEVGIWSWIEKIPSQSKEQKKLK